MVNQYCMSFITERRFGGCNVCCCNLYVYLCVLIRYTCCTRVPFPLQYPVIESLFEREAKRVVYVDTRVGMRAQEKKDRDEEEASRRQQVSYVHTFC